jgi:hypothetical protein
VEAKTPYVTSIDQRWLFLDHFLEVTDHSFCIIDGLDEYTNLIDEVAPFIRRLTQPLSSASSSKKVAIFSRLGLSSMEEDFKPRVCHRIDGFGVPPGFARGGSTPYDLF